MVKFKIHTRLNISTGYTAHLIRGTERLNNKVLVAIFLLFTVFALLLPLDAIAQSQRIVSIVQINPSDGTGPAGSKVTLLGTIATLQGSYQVLLGKTVVTSGTADGYYVNANFTVPELLAATYALTLRDTRINVNATDQFSVITGHSISTVPALVQEGSSVTLVVSVTGGQLGIPYGANVAVVSPTGTTYTAALNLGTPNGKGTASKQITFPSSDFSPTGGTTDYSGSYTLKFNQTLFVGEFKVNILDSSFYHRGQTAYIHAIGYQANQVATISITSVKTGAIIDTISVTSSSDGVIDKPWVVTANTPIGDCSIKITPEGTPKLVFDRQSFTVIGYDVKVKVISLSDAPVSNIIVETLDSATGVRSNATTGANGIANFNLERGSHGIIAFWNDVNVGEANITVTGDDTYTLRCRLTDMKIIVKTEDGIALPFIDLNIKYRYQIGSISRNGQVSGQTDPSGSFTLTSALAGATYNIDASLYNQVFNPSNNSVNNLLNQATSEVTIICPSKNITLDITGYSQKAIPDARIELVELSNGVFYSAKTDAAGSAITDVTFGMYRLRVYKDNTIINETSISVFSNSHKQVHCALYGINLSVSVVDLFGSPISNADVMLNGPTKVYTTTTENSGIAEFENIIGGNMQIIAQAQGIEDASQAIIVNVNEPTMVQVKIERYVALGATLMQASTLITIITIIMAVILFLIVEFYRKRKFKVTANVA